MGSGSSKKKRDDKPPQQKLDYVRLKAVLVGNTRSGKTAIFNRYITNQYSPYYEKTKKAIFGQKISLTTQPVTATFCLELWDTPSDVEDPSLLHVILSDAQIIIICVDAMHEDVADNVKTWMENEIICHYVRENSARVAVLVTKCDLCPPNVAEVFTQSLDELTAPDSQYPIALWCPVSAKEKINLEGSSDAVKQMCSIMLFCYAEAKKELDKVDVYDPNKGEMATLQEFFSRKG
uniref:Uncharacterized protein n=1 Tax=Chromera velia CCMP2878 TaxID=1169474 RepID=A0A0G4IDD6_9ALVE|eukprot:Cvel_2339.t1-p1 / transcript=Cvel_2339.t1 / gene=Cvel_2339 / organism=Chromera_velia_CCMP2878 / gene_product=Ras-related protein Rab-32C, putative / transcript_product=Ras-related protein Rab-32C, putative / location=Cvel_scaffold90:112768-116530(-) / protein_length=234 / sequence_SO=supercontig / SO=protein_coding / is_pseudo=false